MKERNIQPIRLPNNISKAIILSGPNDTRLPKQIAEDIQCTPGVTQIAMYQSDAKRKTCDFRITIKSSDAFNKYIFIPVMYDLFVYVKTKKKILKSKTFFIEMEEQAVDIADCIAVEDIIENSSSENSLWRFCVTQ